MKNLHVKAATVIFRGEPSVGIFGTEWELTNLDFDPDVYATEEDALSVLEEFRTKIEDAYETLIGEPVSVMFDTEIDEINAAIDALCEEDEARAAVERAITEGPGPYRMTGNPNLDGTFKA